MTNPPLISGFSSTSWVSRRKPALVLLQAKRSVQARVTSGLCNPPLNPSLTPKTSSATSEGRLLKQERARWGKLTNVTPKDNKKMSAIEVGGSVTSLQQGTENTMRDERNKEPWLMGENLAVKGAESSFRCQRLPGHLPAGWRGPGQKGYPPLLCFAVSDTLNSACLSEDRLSSYQLPSTQIYQAGNTTTYQYQHI